MTINRLSETKIECRQISSIMSFSCFKTQNKDQKYLENLEKLKSSINFTVKNTIDVYLVCSLNLFDGVMMHFKLDEVNLEFSKNQLQTSFALKVQLKQPNEALFECLVEQFVFRGEINNKRLDNEMTVNFTGSLDKFYLNFKPAFLKGLLIVASLVQNEQTTAKIMGLQVNSKIEFPVDIIYKAQNFKTQEGFKTFSLNEETGQSKEKLSLESWIIETNNRRVIPDFINNIQKSIDEYHQLNTKAANFDENIAKENLCGIKIDQKNFEFDISKNQVYSFFPSNNKLYCIQIQSSTINSMYTVNIRTNVKLKNNTKYKLVIRLYRIHKNENELKRKMKAVKLTESDTFVEKQISKNIESNEQIKERIDNNIELESRQNEANEEKQNRFESITAKYDDYENIQTGKFEFNKSKTLHQSVKQPMPLSQIKSIEEMIKTKAIKPGEEIMLPFFPRIHEIYYSISMDYIPKEYSTKSLSSLFNVKSHSVDCLNPNNKQVFNFSVLIEETEVDSQNSNKKDEIKNDLSILIEPNLKIENNLPMKFKLIFAEKLSDKILKSQNSLQSNVSTLSSKYVTIEVACAEFGEEEIYKFKCEDYNLMFVNSILHSNFIRLCSNIDIDSFEENELNLDNSLMHESAIYTNSQEEQDWPEEELSQQTSNKNIRKTKNDTNESDSKPNKCTVEKRQNSADKINPNKQNLNIGKNSKDQIYEEKEIYENDKKQNQPTSDYETKIEIKTIQSTDFDKPYFVRKPNFDQKKAPFNDYHKKPNKTEETLIIHMQNTQDTLVNSVLKITRFNNQFKLHFSSEFILLSELNFKFKLKVKEANFEYEKINFKNHLELLKNEIEAVNQATNYFSLEELSNKKIVTKLIKKKHKAIKCFTGNISIRQKKLTIEKDELKTELNMKKLFDKKSLTLNFNNTTVMVQLMNLNEDIAKTGFLFFYYPFYIINTCADDLLIRVDNYSDKLLILQKNHLFNSGDLMPKSKNLSNCEFVIKGNSNSHEWSENFMLFAENKNLKIGNYFLKIRNSNKHENLNLKLSVTSHELSKLISLSKNENPNFRIFNNLKTTIFVSQFQGEKADYAILFPNSFVDYSYVNSFVNNELCLFMNISNKHVLLCCINFAEKLKPVYVDYRGFETFEVISEKENDCFVINLSPKFELDKGSGWMSRGPNIRSFIQTTFKNQSRFPLNLEIFNKQQPKNTGSTSIKFFVKESLVSICDDHSKEILLLRLEDCKMEFLKNLSDEKEETELNLQLNDFQIDSQFNFQFHNVK